MPADRAAMGSVANNIACYLGSAIRLAVVTVLVTQAGLGAGRARLIAGWNKAVLAPWSYLLPAIAPLRRARNEMLKPGGITMPHVVVKMSRHLYSHGLVRI